MFIKLINKILIIFDRLIKIFITLGKFLQIVRYMDKTLYNQINVELHLF